MQHATEIPSGLERCILPPLERPAPEKGVSEPTEDEQLTDATTAAAAAAAAAAADTEAEQPVPEESETIKGGDTGTDTTSQFNFVGTRPARRGSGGGTKAGGSRSFRRSRYNITRNGSACGCQEPAGDSSGNALHAKNYNSYGRAGRRRSSRAVRGGGSGVEGEIGHGEYATTDAARGYLSGFPGGAGGGGKEGGGEGGGLTAVPHWSASNLSSFSLEAMFAASPLLAALSLAGGLSPTLFMAKDGGLDAGAGAGVGGDGRRGGSDNRSTAPALAADKSSLRTRRLLEEREAGRERQKLLKSLGVGTRRSLKRVPGKRGGVQLVTTVVASPRRPRPPQVQG